MIPVLVDTCIAYMSYIIIFFLQPDMQRAVEFRFRDTSTLVREAAVDLVGRFVLSRPELTSQYYDMICERIRVSTQPRLSFTYIVHLRMCALRGPWYMQ